MSLVPVRILTSNELAELERDIATLQTGLDVAMSALNHYAKCDNECSCSERALAATKLILKILENNGLEIKN